MDVLGYEKSNGFRLGAGISLLLLALLGMFWVGWGAVPGLVSSFMSSKKQAVSSNAVTVPVDCDKEFALPEFVDVYTERNFRGPIKYTAYPVDLGSMKGWVAGEGSTREEAINDFRRVLISRYTELADACRTRKMERVGVAKTRTSHPQDFHLQ